MEPMKYLRAQWDRAAGIAFVAGGAILLLLGWDGVSNTAYPAEQIPYVLSGGLGGLLLVGVGAVLWISADLRDEWRKLDSLERAIRDHLETRPSTPRPAASPDSVPGDGEQVSKGTRRPRRKPVEAVPSP